MSQTRALARRKLFKLDRPRAIDSYIDYFGGRPAADIPRANDPCGEGLLNALAGRRESARQRPASDEPRRSSEPSQPVREEADDSGGRPMRHRTKGHESGRIGRPTARPDRTRTLLGLDARR